MIAPVTNGQRIDLVALAARQAALERLAGDVCYRAFTDLPDDAVVDAEHAPIGVVRLDSRLTVVVVASWRSEGLWFLAAPFGRPSSSGVFRVGFASGEKCAREGL